MTSATRDAASAGTESTASNTSVAHVRKRVHRTVTMTGSPLVDAPNLAQTGRLRNRPAAHVDGIIVEPDTVDAKYRWLDALQLVGSLPPTLGVRLRSFGVGCVLTIHAIPGQKINAAPGADNTAVNAFYRLIEAPAESQITPRNILAPHRERSIQRMRGQRTVLAIQDGTDLNFSRCPGCDGLQLIGKNQTTATSLGLHMHTTLAVSATGLPLGVLALGFDPVKTLSKEEEKRRKTQRWLEGFNATADAARERRRPPPRQRERQHQPDGTHRGKPGEREVVASGHVEDPARHDRTDRGTDSAEEHDVPEDRAVGAGAEKLGHGGETTVNSPSWAKSYTATVANSGRGFSTASSTRLRMQEFLPPVRSEKAPTDIRPTMLAPPITVSSPPPRCVSSRGRCRAPRIAGAPSPGRGRMGAGPATGSRTRGRDGLRRTADCGRPGGRTTPGWRPHQERGDQQTRSPCAAPRRRGVAPIDTGAVSSNV